MADPVRERIVRILGMLGSEHDGERLNAARLADRTRLEAGLTWAELLKPPRNPLPKETEAFKNGFKQGYEKGLLDSRLGNGHAALLEKWQALAKQILNNHEDQLSEWEVAFLRGLVFRARRPTARQTQILQEIREKYDGGLR